MNSDLVLQGHHARRYTPLPVLRIAAQKSVSVMFLQLSFYGILDDSNTPFLFGCKAVCCKTSFSK